MPDQFISCAETHGLIHELTDQVLDSALEWYAKRFAGSDLTIAVNLSCRTTSRIPFLDETARGASDFSLVDGITARCRAAN
jgi:EAL domain-containing protein (putative c-di-GMP-specific phosphodiesterase class I)